MSPLQVPWPQGDDAWDGGDIELKQRAVELHGAVLGDGSAFRLVAAGGDDRKMDTVTQRAVDQILDGSMTTPKVTVLFTDRSMIKTPLQ